MTNRFLNFLNRLNWQNQEEREPSLHHLTLRELQRLFEFPLSNLDWIASIFMFYQNSKIGNFYTKVSSKLVFVLSVFQFWKALFYFSWNPKVWCLITFGDFFKKTGEIIKPFMLICLQILKMRKKRNFLSTVWKCLHIISFQFVCRPGLK